MAYGGGSGTCDITGVPTPSMPQRTIHEGGASRFSISFNPSKIVPGQSHQVTLSRIAGSGGFRGLLMYAENEGGDRVGTFDVANTPSVQQLDCSAIPNSTITHNNSSNFTSTFTINWQAPTNVFGNITFSSIVYETSPTLTFNIPTPIVVEPEDILFTNGFENL